MEDQKFEELAKRWPDLFQKSGDFEFSIGDGWYDIIDTLCGMLSYRAENSKRRLKYAMENPNAKFNKPISELEADVNKALEELPIIAQVKEKFGTLRFYVDGGTPEMHNYIEFAEAMTSRVCEVCGSPGKSRNDGWVRVLCDKHNREQEEKNATPERIALRTRLNTSSDDQ
jgi:hypothetical protein